MTGSTRTAPDRRAGHYSEDRSAWYDERRKRWYRLLPEQESVQIELEDVGDSTWWKRILTTLFTQSGQQHLRFIARRTSGSPTEHAVAMGRTFASPRWTADTPPQPAWAPEMSASLTDVRDDLEQAAWLLEGRGDQAWSYRYGRPKVDWSREYVSKGGA